MSYTQQDSPMALRGEGQIRPMTVSERLKTRKATIEQELVNINATISLFEKNPETQQVLDALAKLNFNY